MKDKDEEIIFRAEISFKGPSEDFKKILAGLNNIGVESLKIDTVPLPEESFDGLRAGKWITPEKGPSGIRINTVPLPEEKIGSLMIGTWPTPERNASGIMIDTVPLPERKSSGLLVGTWPILEKDGRFGRIPLPEKGLNRELLENLTEDMPKFEIIKDIYGGIHNPHMHLDGKVVLIDRERFQEHVGHIALDIMKDLTERIEETLPVRQIAR